MKRIVHLLLLVSFSVCTVHAASNACNDQCPAHSRRTAACQDMVFGAIPASNHINEIKICRNHYLVSANTIAKTPNWIAYHLTSAYVPQPINRENYFCPDPCLKPGQRAETSDYNGLYPNYNRGHLTPAKDNKWDLPSYQESFYLSNIVPQQPENNGGIWLKLESHMDVWLKTYGELYIITGPVYDYNGVKHQEVGNGKIWAPAALFKVIYVPSKQRVLSFIIPNQPINSADLPRYLTSINDVNQRTGLNLFAELPAALKAEVPTALWSLS